MTIPALLSRFGMDAQRYVSESGRIIFDGVTETAEGRYSHAEYGKVTALKNHTFHGGAGAPDDHLPAEAWWLREGALVRHDRAVGLAYPGFVRSSLEDGSPPVWAGYIDTGRGHFMIGVFARHDGGLPAVRILKGPKMGIARGRRWIPSHHLYLNGDLCVADRDDWDPQEHTVADVIGWAAHWLAAYTEWRMTERWPVEGMHASGL